MRLHIQLIAETPTSTISMLTIEGKPQCWILEDGFNITKIPGKTRIPPGIYPIVKHTSGRFFEAHRKKWGHSFVPMLAGVPNYSFILIHPGNTVEDTEGCLLPGNSAHFNGRAFMVSDSSDAYLKLYEKIESALFENDEVVDCQVSREVRMGA